MDSRNPENNLKKFDEKSLEKLQFRVVFTDPAYQFVFKKTEKIIAALYLVTNLISDTEPLKWQVRKTALALMSDTLALKKTATSDARQTIMGLITGVSEIISLLKIASVAEQVSTMNYSVLQRELALLMNSLDALHGSPLGNGSMVLPQDFFAVPAPVVSPLHSAPTTSFSSKGQYRTSFDINDKVSPETPRESIKDSRREVMIKMLKPGKPLGIKDFAKEIKDCSGE